MKSHVKLPRRHNVAVRDVEVHVMKLLVSVRNAQEARAAVAGSADWIDLKEPAAGALGAVSAAIARAAVNAVEDACLNSAALGELMDWPNSSGLLAIPEIQVVKLGLANCGQLADWSSRWMSVFEMCFEQKKQLAAVIYADWQNANAPHPEEILECMLRAGGKYLLIDTFDKQGLSSIEILGREYMVRLLRLAKESGLTTAVAGRLQVNDLANIASWPVDIVAIRGAACAGDRNSTIDAGRIRQFRRCLEIANENAKVLNLCLPTRG
jgi:uncharacterized protein (UPF0264 family)